MLKLQTPLEDLERCGARPSFLPTPKFLSTTPYLQLKIRPKLAKD